MLGLTIVNIEIVAETDNGNFSVKIPFGKGLNIIRADNSSGKSTCVNAIAYGLGLEAILGPRGKRPFPKSLYEVIVESKESENECFVHRSYVVVTIKNSNNKEAVLTRDVLGYNDKVSVKSESDSDDYFLGSSGTVGSAKSEKGFHHWLADFIGWELPTVANFDGTETKLYLECIFPLFFIEQKRGWSEIQANTPTYGIKNVKKSAAEFCLAIDTFEHEKRIVKLKNEISSAVTKWDKLRATAESIADFKSVQVNKLADLDIKRSIYHIDFKYLENDVCISVNEQLRSLNKFIEKLSQEIVDKTPDDEKLNAQLAVIGVLRREAEKTSNSVEMVMLSISEVDGKLLTLKHDFDQYQQLRRLKNVGSDISADIDTRKCPICENDLYDTLGRRTVTREPMTLEENIEFLKNQMDFFSSIKGKSIAQLQELQVKARFLYSKMDVESSKLSDMREDVDDVNGETKAILREKIQSEILLKDVLKLKERQDEFNKQILTIHSEWSDATNSLKQARKGLTVSGKESVISKLESIIKGNLRSFNFKPADINSVSISRQTLRPEQEGYDIVAETSASDYIRVIWSYTLALLELAGKDKEQKIKHGGFVVFDEPRQHEASMVSFTGLIGKVSGSSSYGGQVIFATSLEESELKTACADKDVNLVCFDDYVLSLKVETEALQESIANQLSSADENMNWIDLLQDTSPGHYGIDDLSVFVDSGEILVDVSRKIFTYQNTQLSFSARMGASSDEHGYDATFNVAVSGSGSFEVIDERKDLNITEFSIDGRIDLYEEV